jgi:uncharacterized iron-regulated membrane protein
MPSEPSGATSASQSSQASAASATATAGTGPGAMTPPAGDGQPRPAGWFRAFWRWHFYASFLVAPIMLLLAVTGMIYLLRFQIEPMLHAGVMTVDAPADAQSAARQPYNRQLAAVRAAYPDAEIVSMTEPSAADRPTVFSTTVGEQPRDIYVNPWDGQVLGAINPDTTLSGYAVRLHGELMAGPIGDAVIELAACWALVMAVTGYLLFVRGRQARTRRIAAKAKGAVLRHRHGLVGLVVGVGLLALLITGLPWTGVWGEKAQQLATAGGSSLWSDDPGALSNPTSKLDESLPHSHDVPWALGKTPPCPSRPAPAPARPRHSTPPSRWPAGKASPIP